MTYKNSQAHASKIQSVLIASIMILAMTLPTTSILTANAISTHPSKENAVSLMHFPAHMSSAAKNMQIEISKQVAAHPGWVGHLSWNATSAHITYLGPGDKDPFNVNPASYNKVGGHAIEKNTGFLQHYGSVSPLTTYYEGLEGGDGITQDCTSGSTAEVDEYDYYDLVASTTSTVDNYQILNAMNSDNSHWLQVGTVYNETGDQAWKVVYNSWTINGYTNDFKKIDTISNVSNGNQVEEYIQADPFNAGQYDLGASDQVYPYSSDSVTISESGDTGYNINLGQKTYTDQSGHKYYFPSAGMVEQITTSQGSGYNFGSETYNPYDFIDSFGGSATSCVNGWDGAVTSGSVSVSSTSNNPAQDTFQYG